MPRKRMTAKQLANLKQYKDAPPEVIDEVIQGAYVEFENEERVKTYLDNMEKEYDLTEMNFNDRSALTDLARISIDIEDTQRLYRVKLSSENIDWFEIEKIVNNLKVLRQDRSKIEYDLNISRRSRQSSEETSLVDTIESFKLRAKKMLKERLSYVYCPECKMLLATVWFQVPEAGNSLTLTCSREKCGHIFTVTGSELLAKKNKNLDTVLDT